MQSWRTVKYEEVYLKQHGNMPDLLMGLTQYFQFYNQERRHQSLAYKTPDEVYKSAIGGGAKIVDKFNDTGEASEPVQQNRDSAVQLECEQSSILTQIFFVWTMGSTLDTQIQEEKPL